MQEALPGFARKALAAGVLGLGALAGAHSLSNHDAVASTGAMPQHSYTQQAEPMTNVDPDIVNGHHRNYPIELTYMQGGELKKEFTQLMVPIIKKQNDAIRQERNHLVKIVQKGKLSGEDKTWVAEKMKKYEVVADPDMTVNLKELLLRIDVIPVGLALSQAALESGWGTSRFAQQANALFGQKTTNRNSIDSQTDKYAKFNDFGGSVEAYMRNLNKHAAYAEFRDARHQLRKSGKPLDPLVLADHLKRYSTKKNDYIKAVKTLMKANGFHSIT